MEEKGERGVVEIVDEALWPETPASCRARYKPMAFPPPPLLLVLEETESKPLEIIPVAAAAVELEPDPLPHGLTLREEEEKEEEIQKEELLPSPPREAAHSGAPAALMFMLGKPAEIPVLPLFDKGRETGGEGTPSCSSAPAAACD